MPRSEILAEPSRMRVVAAGVLASALFACNFGKEDPDRPLPTVGVPLPSGAPAAPLGQEPPSKAAPAAANPTPRPRDEDTTAAAAAPTTTGAAPATTATAGTAPESTAAPTAAAPAAPAIDAGAAVDAVKKAGDCIDKCQAAYRSCLSAQDAAVPDFAKCQPVLDGCKTSCS